MVLILVGVWASVLIPPILKARAQGRPADSVVDFRRRLNVLQRTSPSVVPAANRMRGPATIFDGLPPGSQVQQRTGMDRRRRVQKRRRDVCAVFLVVIVASFVLGALPPLRALWAVHVVADLLFAGYVAMLARLRNLAAERDEKVRYLPASVGPPALALRRSAN